MRLRKVQRISILHLSLIGGLAIASPLAAPELEDALRKCALESNAELRLACFDAVATSVASPTSTARPAPNPEQNFGYRGVVAKEDKQRERERELASAPREIRTKVAAVTRRPMSPMVITLENGQVWAQRSYDSRFDLKAGDEVAIRAAALGSFLLVGPRGGSTRVTRVR